MNEEKTIRFIDSNHKELFTIPDGGNIVVTHADGETAVLSCKYLDSRHTEIGGKCYQNSRFTEIMEENGITYKPETEKEVVQGYKITRKIPVGIKVFVMGHNPNAPSPYVTWQGRKGEKGYAWGNYFSSRSNAYSDLIKRSASERNNMPFRAVKKSEYER